MTERVRVQFKPLIERCPQLAVCRNGITKAYKIIENCYSSSDKLLIAENGGSAADAEHIVGELMKDFVKPRKLPKEYADRLVEVNPELGKTLVENLQGAFPAIALDGHTAFSTAYQNDYEPLLCFAQQVNGYGNTGDVFLRISTSGNSKNVLYAAVTAKSKGMKVVGLTGAKESMCIRMPETETYMI